MKALVTGAAGFLGSHLVEKLLKNGHEVIGIDNLSTGSLSNLSSFIGKPNFEFVFHDVVNPFEFEIDTIFNFACPASPIQYQANPTQTLLTNILGTLNGLRLANKRKAVFLHASTSEIYGDPEVSPQHEDYLGNVNCIGPRACYDEGKRAAETAIYDFKRIYGLDVRVVRIFNTYGPKMARDDGRVVSNFIVSALSNNEIRIYGDGNQTRSFCYVDDTIEAIYKLYEIDTSPSGPINVGNPIEITMNTLASEVIRKTKSDSKVVFDTLPIDDPKRRCPDINLAKNLLNWEPRVALELGLENTIDFFRNN